MVLWCHHYPYCPDTSNCRSKNRPIRAQHSHTNATYTYITHSTLFQHIDEKSVPKVCILNASLFLWTYFLVVANKIVHVKSFQNMYLLLGCLYFKMLKFTVITHTGGSPPKMACLHVLKSTIHPCNSDLTRHKLIIAIINQCTQWHRRWGKKIMATLVKLTKWS